MNLVAGWSAQDFNDLDQLIDARLSGEEGLAEKEFGHDAADWPNVDSLVVACSAKN